MVALPVPLLRKSVAMSVKSRSTCQANGGSSTAGVAPKCRFTPFSQSPIAVMFGSWPLSKA